MVINNQHFSHFPWRLGFITLQCTSAYNVQCCLGNCPTEDILKGSMIVLFSFCKQPQHPQNVPYVLICRPCVLEISCTSKTYVVLFFFTVITAICVAKQLMLNIKQTFILRRLINRLSEDAFVCSSSSSFNQQSSTIFIFSPLVMLPMQQNAILEDESNQIRSTKAFNLSHQSKATSVIVQSEEENRQINQPAKCLPLL